MTLLTTCITKEEHHLVFGGDNGLTVARVNAIVNSGAKAIVISDNECPTSLEDKVNSGKVIFHKKEAEVGDLTSFGRKDVDFVVDRVFIVSHNSKVEEIFHRCLRLRIPINTTDRADFSTFTLLSTYENGPFKVGVSTLGKGCKLASKIRREIVNGLPENIDEICDNIGKLKQEITQQDNVTEDAGENEEDSVNTTTLNKLVDEFGMSNNDRKSLRSRWLSQIVEYYPLAKLGSITMADLEANYSSNSSQNQHELTTKRQKTEPKGKISLVGAGPGSADLLTAGAINEIMTADLVLADKLVPQQVLDVIPKKTKVFIARKFPGNAENAQQELLTMGLQALEQNQNVVRLKQGDPYIFGRGGEEYGFFSQKGFTPKVIPGITSALAAPVLAGIPVTHRDVCDQVLICTGTGRRGKVPELPDYNPSRTTVFLMALHRVVELIPKLVEEKQWEWDMPVAVIERASCPDQRVIRTTLKYVGEAIEANGSRPPGLFVAGDGCKILHEVEEKWRVEEGCS